MKNVILTSLLALAVVGCINSSTNFTNRSITNMATHELIGERAQVSSSPSSNDDTVNAEKTVEQSTKLNAGQTVADSSTNDQHRSAAEKTAEKTAEKPVEKQEEKPVETK